MKYGVVFLIASGFMTTYAITSKGWFLLFLWPAVSFATVAVGYLHSGPAVFGKRQDGKLAPQNVVVLFPYLAYLWSLWYVIRVVQREPAVNQLSEGLLIGRRLLSSELPQDIETVVDLTCEFNEPRELRSKSYLLCPILDGFVPAMEQLVAWVQAIDAAREPIFIHCAEGHGCTGLVAAALVVARGQATTAMEALQIVQSKRPLVRLGKRQFRLLEEVVHRLRRAGDVSPPSC
jgi:protein-tyrosine phosphatase